MRDGDGLICAPCMADPPRPDGVVCATLYNAASRDLVLQFKHGGRIGHARWRRNLAVAMGNAWRETGDAALAEALRAARDGAGELLAEHIDWALAQRV